MCVYAITTTVAKANYFSRASETKNSSWTYNPLMPIIFSFLTAVKTLKCSNARSRFFLHFQPLSRSLFEAVIKVEDSYSCGPAEARLNLLKPDGVILKVNA